VADVIFGTTILTVRRCSGIPSFRSLVVLPVLRRYLALFVFAGSFLRCFMGKILLTV
jgi:hypothetical protein